LIQLYQNQTEKLQQIVQHVFDGILEINNDGKIEFVNAAVEHLFGYSVEEMTGFLLKNLFAEPFSSQYQKVFENQKLDTVILRDKFVQIIARRKNGCEFPIDFSLTKLPSNQKKYLAVIHDITVHKHKEEELRYLSTIDPLTQLTNRRGFDDCFTKEWQRCQRNNNSLSFIMIDIDFFKLFNDTYGHQTGDICLKKVADTLKKQISRPGDILARLGGEEFGIILADTSKNGLREIAKKIRTEIAALRIPHTQSPEQVVTISLGAASTLYSNPCSSVNELYELADKALYEAKKSGRNVCVLR